MTATRVGNFFLKLWLVGILIKFLTIFMDIGLPTPTSFLFLGIFTPVFYDWARSRDLAQDRALFLQELADLLNLGIALPDALDKLVALRKTSFGHKYSEFTKTLEVVNDKVQSGDTFTAALGETPGVPSMWTDFLPFLEDPAELAQTLEDFALNERSRLSFPLLSVLRIQLMVPMLTGIAIFLSIYILPTFLELFKGMNLSLPLPTRVFMMLTEVYQIGFFLPLSIFVILIFLSIVNLRVRTWFWRLAYYVPGLRKMVSLHSQAKIYQTLASGLRVGASLPDCYLQASKVMTIKRYKNHLATMHGGGTPSVLEGLSKEPKLFSASYLWLIEQGEDLEALPEALQTAGEVASTELDALCKKLVVNVDTIILCGIGFVVFLTLIAIWLPLYQLIGNLG